MDDVKKDDNTAVAGGTLADLEKNHGENKTQVRYEVVEDVPQPPATPESTTTPPPTSSTPPPEPDKPITAPEVKEKAPEPTPAAPLQNWAKVEESEEPKTSSRAGIIAVAVIGGIIVGAGLGYVLWGRGANKQTAPETSSVTETVTPKVTAGVTQTPAATPPAQLKKSDLKIEVLNGSGVSGAATKMADYLQSLGYVVSKIGNASKSTYTETEILITGSKKAYLAMLEKDLAVKYTLATQAGSMTEKTGVDAQVIIGKK